jgi:hypothetical protein
MEKNSTEIPPNVIEAIRSAVWVLRNAAGRLEDKIYADPQNRCGMSIDLENASENLEFVLQSYGLPGRVAPAWLIALKTE